MRENNKNSGFGSSTFSRVRVSGVDVGLTLFTGNFKNVFVEMKSCIDLKNMVFILIGAHGIYRK